MLASAARGTAEGRDALRPPDAGLAQVAQRLRDDPPAL
jgi:hypothetical protein